MAGKRKKRVAHLPFPTHLPTHPCLVGIRNQYWLPSSRSQIKEIGNKVFSNAHGLIGLLRRDSQLWKLSIERSGIALINVVPLTRGRAGGNCVHAVRTGNDFDREGPVCFWPPFATSKATDFEVRIFYYQNSSVIGLDFNTSVTNILHQCSFF